MSRLLIVLTLVVSICGCSFSARSGQDNPVVRQIVERYPELNHRAYTIDIVKRVVDGDTFETKSGDKVRLIGVNTPEIGEKAERYGMEAKRFTENKLQGQTVILFQDVGPKDKYGRLLRYVFLESEPTMFNETLLTEGYANVMTVPPNVLFADKFVALERKARENRKGLWGDENAAVSASCAEPKIKGNINSRNEKIYHMPGSRYYNSTKPERLFCTEEEAQAAGFRKAAN